jgi:GT2 family glycosyltransferase
MTQATTGAVVIGRNEGDRLRACLASVMPQAGQTIYVDSGSTDGSITVAAGLGAAVIELDTDTPFTAARARNTGWKRLAASGDIDFVQFVDGDSTLDPAWIERAVQTLAKQESVAAVCGHVREANPTRNIYHRLAAMEWDTPVGDVAYCGGIALFRLTALAQVDGFRDQLATGEEPELCLRLNAAGWRVIKVDAEMAVHDIDTNTFRQWWRRTRRAGSGFAEVVALHADSPAQLWVRETRSIWIWGCALPLAALLLAWPTRGISLAVAAAFYLVLFLKVLRWRRAECNAPFGSAALYAGMCVVAKWPQALGQCMYRCSRLRRRSV